MKRILIAICLGLSLLPLGPVVAQTELQKTLVVERCDLIKQSLDKQRRRDLVARINRGRDYQNLIDQQQALVSRLKNNQMDAVMFEQRLSELKIAFDDFRTAYTAYDDSLGSLIAIDCKNQPEGFISTLEVTRNLRKSVGLKTDTIAQILSLQRELIVDLKNRLAQIEQTIVGER